MDRLITRDALRYLVSNFVVDKTTFYSCLLLDKFSYEICSDPAILKRKIHTLPLNHLKIYLNRHPNINWDFNELLEYFDLDMLVKYKKRYFIPLAILVNKYITPQFLEENNLGFDFAEVWNLAKTHLRCMASLAIFKAMWTAERLYGYADIRGITTIVISSLFTPEMLDYVVVEGIFLDEIAMSLILYRTYKDFKDVITKHPKFLSIIIQTLKQARLDAVSRLQWLPLCSWNHQILNMDTVTHLQNLGVRMEVYDILMMCTPTPPVDWDIIALYHPLDLPFFEEHREKLDPNLVLLNRNLESFAILSKYFSSSIPTKDAYIKAHRATLKDITLDDLIRYGNYFCWRTLSTNENISDDLVQRYTEYYKIHGYSSSNIWDFSEVIENKGLSTYFVMELLGDSKINTLNRPITFDIAEKYKKNGNEWKYWVTSK